MGDNLKSKTAKGLTWGLVNNGSTQLLNLVFGIVLARLLSPEDYGVVGVLTVFTLIAGNLQACGFTQGLCNMRQPEHRDYNAVFWFNITMSACLYIALFLSAPLIARFFHTPVLLWLSRVVFLTIPISALSTIAGAYMFKNLMVKQSALVGIAALLVSGAVGITLAFMGFKCWALAWQQVAYTSVVTVARYCVCPFRPSWSFTFEPVRRMLPFSVKMMLTTVLNSLSTQVLTFLFGRLFPMDAVGNYSQANKWNTMAGGLLQNTVNQVAQPVMAEVRDDAERSLRVLRKMVRFTAFLAFPAMFGLAMVAEEFILTAIGAKWLPSANMLSLLAMAGSTLPLYALLQNVVISRGRSDMYLWLNVVQIATQIGIVIVMKDYGIEQMVLWTAVFTAAYLFVWFAFTQRVVKGYSTWSFLRDIVPFALVAAVTMGITWWSTNWLLPNCQHALLLVARVAMAAVLYTILIYLTGAEILRESIKYILPQRDAS